MLIVLLALLVLYFSYPCTSSNSFAINSELPGTTQCLPVSQSIIEFMNTDDTYEQPFASFEILNSSYISDILGEANRDLFHDSFIEQNFNGIHDTFNTDYQGNVDLSSNVAVSELSDFALESPMQLSSSLMSASTASVTPSCLPTCSNDTN